MSKRSLQKCFFANDEKDLVPFREERTLSLIRLVNFHHDIYVEISITNPLYQKSIGNNTHEDSFWYDWKDIARKENKRKY